jgi:hypothetical protein
VSAWTGFFGGMVFGLVIAVFVLWLVLLLGGR